jgi:cytochrome c556
VDEGIYTEDFAMIEKGGKAIAEHPVMTEKDKKLVKNTLGSAMKRFVSFDMTVHHHADSLAEAARNKKMNEVLRHYRIVQQGCVDCHTNFRTKISEARK